MPKALEQKMRAGYRKSGLSKEEVDHRVYGAMNNQGYMRGSKETAKGKALDKKMRRAR